MVGKASRFAFLPSRIGTVQRSAFNVQRSAFSVHRSAAQSVRRKPLNTPILRHAQSSIRCFRCLAFDFNQAMKAFEYVPSPKHPSAETLPFGCGLLL